ncbi:Histidinol dehydrogenase [bacterium HR40]|nr:Histidinol dehydrogenase [bacterium HR40]
MLRLDRRDPGFEVAFAELVARRREESEDVRAQVAAILAEVKRRGDAAVVEFTARFDRLPLTAEGLPIGAAEIEEAIASCAPEDLDALALAASRIRAFHERQRPTDLAWTDGLGVRLGLRWRPLEAVGIYVPGGRAAYPSSVLMNAIPARVAGVERIVMTVPAPGGELSPLVLAAARLAGVDEIFRIGGAQAIAALAFGTERIRPVDKIVGPGNAYVAEAKRQVFGHVGIDSIAGPSEVVIVADGHARPDWVAADLLAQAEHDPRAQSILITDCPALADAVSAEVERQLGELAHPEVARTSWREQGAIILVARLEEAVPLVDRLAPEHLQLVLEDDVAEAFAAQVRHAGAIFLGAYTPEVIGDYVGGPNHVLPTGRTARYASGLSVYDFLKRTTLLGCSPAACAELVPAAARLARGEGLEAHARAVELRLGNRR